MFAEDLSLFFATEDFAVQAVMTINNAQKTVKVIINTPTMDVAIYDTEIVADTPFFFAATGDIAGLRKPNPVVIGGTNYRVEKVTHDGTGLSTVYLSK